MARGRRRPLVRPARARRVDSAPMMKKLSSPFWFGVLTTIALGCGAKVVVDSPGVGGAGGTGGIGQGGSGLSTTIASVTVASVAASSSSSGSSGSSIAASSSSSSGAPSPCDMTNSCETCVNCSVDMVCAEQWEKCSAIQQCMQLMYCLADCQDEQICIDKCLASFPEGIDPYNETAVCVVCQACFFDCGASTGNCP